MRDFADIMERLNLYRDSRFNKSKLVYVFPNGSLIEFFSVDQEEKVRGRKRDILFINEANELRFKDYTQLTIRTIEKVIIDYNPSIEFWVFDKVLNRDDCDFHKSTYKDNPFIEQSVIDEIEGLSKVNDGGILYRVYAQGEYAPMNNRLVFPIWDVIEGVPEGARRIPSGMDFGLSPDPTVLVDLYIKENQLILDERIYENNLLTVRLPGLERLTIQDRLEQMDFPKDQLIIADSQEAKSIIELRSLGYSTYAVKKTPGSVAQGIRLMQNYDIKITQQSGNIINEFKNYLYRIDKDDRVIPEPIDAHNHAVDAARYVILMKDRMW